ncbi:MAG TPA: hypothetical protein VF631_06730 [Allosphingosinicella sp.]|jgi:hypothetical protein|uniref:hypothetical protein n=1 Tax=Allosphingosinicella sp. TaxID=2823234 RepID=UPI002F28311D
MLQAIIALYFLTVLIGGAVSLHRAVQRNLPLIGAALAYKPQPAARQASLEPAGLRAGA